MVSLVSKANRYQKGKFEDSGRHERRYQLWWSSYRVSGNSWRNRAFVGGLPVGQYVVRNRRTKGCQPSAAHIVTLGNLVDDMNGRTRRLNTIFRGILEREHEAWNDTEAIVIDLTS